jgi:cytochrome c oxidase subunit 1
VTGTNVTFLPFFWLGFLGMTRRIVTYPPGEGFATLNLVSSIGAGIIGLSFMIFIYNLYTSARQRVPAPPNPWGAFTLEWATSSPPPRYNFSARYPVPPIRSYAPLLDLRLGQQRMGQEQERAGTMPARRSL